MRNRGINHVRQADVGGIIHGSIDFRRQIKPRHRPPRQAIVLAQPPRHVGGDFQSGSLRSNLAKAYPVVTAHDKAGFGVAGLPTRIPAFGRRNTQQRPRRSSRIAKDRFKPSHRRRSAGDHLDPARGPKPLLGKQLVCISRIGRRCLDRNGPPIRAQFIRNNLRQGCVHALPHLDLRHDNRDMTIDADLDIAAEDMLAGRGNQIVGIGARPHRPDNDQSHTRTAADQQDAA